MNGSLFCKVVHYCTAATPRFRTLLPLTSLQCGALLQSLTAAKSIDRGQQLHAHIITSNILLHNSYLTTKLAAFYANCGHMDHAQHIFDRVPVKNSFLWNSMIRGYASNGFPANALMLYSEMCSSRFKGDNFTYPFVFKACGELGFVRVGRAVHSEAVVRGLGSDVYVGNSLVSMYSNFGEMTLARLVFDKMPVRDVTSWNTLILGYVKDDDPKEALAVFNYLVKNELLVCDGVTMLGLVSACGHLASLQQGKQVHGYVTRNGFMDCTSFLGNSLIEMYSNCGNLLYAVRMFDDVPKRDTVSWNSLISGYAKNGNALGCLKLFCQMIMEGKRPDMVTLVAVLGACDQITALQFGTSVHSYLLKVGFGSTTLVGTSLIDMYAKCGSLFYSRHAFDEISSKSLVTWSTMIAGYGVYGKGKEAVTLFRQMLADGIAPDGAVFTSVLSACSHAGLVLEDLLGRAGHLTEAYNVIKNMDLMPNEDIWAALLSACRLHKNMELAEAVALELMNLNPKRVSSYVSLSNIYAAERRWNDVENVRTIARNSGLRKPPSWSYIEIDKRVHCFLVGDKNHPQTDAIYAKLKDLRQQVEAVGYRPDTSPVLYDMEEDAKMNMLWDHSERLAIALALINTRPGTVIRVTKNLRVCSDCHEVTKVISKLMSREIIMRDMRRFHHFKNGTCSCCDHW
uniref:DYW domain-containing protein n=1 Tax=Kalanchoe fedtschenkoi TaxID=63787 RepID=A0A7N0TG16_KALFE